MKKQSLATLLGVTLLAGCSTTEEIHIPTDSELHYLYAIPEQPTNKWIQEHLSIYESKATAVLASEHDINAYQFLVKLVEKRNLSDKQAIKKAARTERTLNVSYEDLGMGGAASRQPDFIHVLSSPESTKLQEAVSSSSTENPQKTHSKNSKSTSNNNLTSALSTLEDIKNKSKPETNKNVGYSHYELMRFERYCDSGKKMDERDWQFITKANSENNVLPLNLIESCTPPEHDYNDYLAAWTQYCTSLPLSALHKDIVKNSTRPFSVVNPCKKLR